MESPRFPMRVCLLSSHSHGGCAPTVNVFGKTCNMAEVGWDGCQAQPARYQSAGTCQANQFNSTAVHNGATGVRHRVRVSGQVPSCRTLVRSPSCTGTRPATVLVVKPSDPTSHAAQRLARAVQTLLGPAGPARQTRRKSRHQRSLMSRR